MASMVKFDTDGDVKYLKQWGGEFDTCKGIAYNEDKREVTLALEVTSKKLRPNYNFYSIGEKNAGEFMLIRMTESGIMI
jgi:hypothetical protein